jgi:hypothetical protein
MLDALNDGNGKWRSDWSLNSLGMMARLKPGVSLERANAEVTALFEPWLHDRAATIPVPFQRQQVLKQRAVALAGAAGMNGLRLQFIKPLTILMGIVALVLLLACANLSGLMLARATARQREISVRRALGAGSGRLMRQFLAESLLLALCGAAAGFCAAQWFSRVLITMMANGDTLYRDLFAVDGHFGSRRRALGDADPTRNQKESSGECCQCPLHVADFIMVSRRSRW